MRVEYCARMPSQTIETSRQSDDRLPPLQHGDRLTRAEFERRWNAMPELKKAELIGGMVFLASDYRGRVLDRSIPRLENGDHLKRAEFERRWDNMPDLKRAELIDGMVFMSPPVSAAKHGLPHSDLLFWFSTYRGFTPGVVVADNSTWRVSVGDSDPQPDAMVFVRPEYGGKTHFDEDGCVLGTPEMVAEVAASSASYDLNIKRDLYLQNQVPEYIVWLINENRVQWFELADNDYREKTPESDGIYRSTILPGLWLDPASLFEGDLPAITALLQQAAATAAHSAFAATLKSAHDKRS
jgi:Uma2 family endonuclease